MSENGIVQTASRYSVDETLQRLQSTFTQHGLQVFVVVDHSGEAAKVGMKMPNTKLLIFGSPKGGTPLMLASPSIAIDLPLKALVAEDSAGKVSISYNDPAYLQQRHRFPQDLIKNIAGVAALVAKSVE
jgi:uncharacterized protein (DUF302 family)